jgi:hypothetical protein
VDPRLGERLAAFEGRSLWVIDTPDNRAVWSRLQLKPNSSIFKVADPEATVENLTAQLDDIDLHFGPDSFPKDPYVGITVIGLALDHEVEAKLREYGFNNFKANEGGFEANLM